MKTLPYLLLVPALVIAAFLTAGCTSLSPGGVSPSPSPTLSCGFTTCHGLDLTCEPNPPQVCTAVYELGDKCRQYAACSSTSGTCRLVTTPQFDACRSCIQRCGGADTAEIFTCEEKC